MQIEQRIAAGRTSQTRRSKPGAQGRSQIFSGPGLYLKFILWQFAPAR
jgi:hypothetical protein